MPPPVLTALHRDAPGPRRLLHGLARRSPLGFARRVLEVGWEVGRAALARPPAGPRVLRVEAGAAPAAASLALYVHYAPNGRVSEMVRRQLALYRQAGFAIAFVSVAPLVPEEDWQAVREAAWLVIHRRNEGRDFGAWQDAAALALERAAAPEELLLANDSVLGPLRPLDAVFAAMRAGGPGLFGLTENLGGGAHLQSYFLCARGAAAVRDLAGFLAAFRPSAAKWLIVQRGEIALTPAMLAKGYRVAALYGHDRLAAAIAADPAERLALLAADPRLAGLPEPEQAAAVVAALRERPLNPTHHLWRPLVALLGFPFLKTELLRRNPHELPVQGWEALVPPDAPCPLTVLRAHLSAMEG